MDDITDAKKTDIVSKFLDGQVVRTNPFGDNRAGDRAYRRAERITVALYLLTNHVADTEPIRSTVRSEATQLLGRVLSLRNEMRAPESHGFHAVQASIRHLISLVRIMTVSGHVSTQNAATVIEALDELGNFLVTSQRSILSESVTLSREDLMDVHTPMPRSPIRQTREIKDSVMHLNQTQLNTEKDTQKNTATNASRSLSVRSHNILEVLRTGGSLGIKDICANLPEYSEKMVQRELLDLVGRGQVRKMGHKRWSRYSLASA